MTAATGPRTPEGKAISSQNALKHGFRAATAYIPPGMEDDFNQMREDYTAAFLTPKSTPAEHIVFNNLLKDAWNIYRVELLIATINGEQPDDPMNKWDFDKLDRTLNRTKASYRTNMKQLQTIQSTQLVQQFLPPEILEGKTVAPLMNFQQVVNLTKRTHSALAATQQTDPMHAV